MEAILNSIKSRDSSLFVETLLSSWNEITEQTQPEVAILEEVKDFLSKSNTTIASKLSAEGKKIAQLDDTEKGAVVNEFSDVQFLEPRGRFKLTVATRSMVLEGKSGGGNILVDNILTFLLLPSHSSSKKEGEDLLTVIFHDPVKICGKEMRHVLLNLSRTPIKPKGNVIDPELVVTIESKQICDTIFKTFGIKIQQPDARLFRSSTLKTFVRCHKGTQEGAIYPLKCGIVFIKPLLFLTADEIASLTAGRGGSGNTRFVDLRIETVEDKVFEFTNIEREELGALQMYVKGYLETRKSRNAVKAEGNSGHHTKSAEILQNLEMNGGNDDDDDDEDEDDDDYHPDDHSSGDEDVASASSSSDDNSDNDSDNDNEGNKKEKKVKQSSTKATKPMQNKATGSKKASARKNTNKKRPLNLTTNDNDNEERGKKEAKMTIDVSEEDGVDEVQIVSVVHDMTKQEEPLVIEV